MLQSIREWAKEEIKIALEEDSKNHGEAFCGLIPADPDQLTKYTALLKAFNTLLGIPNSLKKPLDYLEQLNRLFAKKPLSPIYDNEKEYWERCSDSEEGVKKYCNTRLFGLFKYEYADGTTKYIDTGRFTFVEVDTPEEECCPEGFVELLNDLFPVEFPYYPAVDPAYVYYQDIDDNAVLLMYMEDKDGNSRTNIDRAFEFTESGYIEIPLKDLNICLDDLTKKLSSDTTTANMDFLDYDPTCDSVGALDPYIESNGSTTTWDDECCIL